MRVRGKSRGDGEGGKNYGGGGHPNDFDNILQLSSNSSTYGHHTNRRPFQNHATFGILLLISLLGCIKISLMIGLPRVRKIAWKSVGDCRSVCRSVRRAGLGQGSLGGVDMGDLAAKSPFVYQACRFPHHCIPSFISSLLRLAILPSPMTFLTSVTFYRFKPSSLFPSSSISQKLTRI